MSVSLFGNLVARIETCCSDKTASTSNCKLCFFTEKSSSVLEVSAQLLYIVGFRQTRRPCFLIVSPKTSSVSEWLSPFLATFFISIYCIIF
jgi:hypothetical protein